MAAGPETQQGQAAALRAALALHRHAASHTATRCADTTAMSQESEVALKRGTGATVLVACR